MTTIAEESLTKAQKTNAQKTLRAVLRSFNKSGGVINVSDANRRDLLAMKTALGVENKNTATNDFDFRNEFTDSLLELAKKVALNQGRDPKNPQGDKNAQNTNSQTSSPVKKRRNWFSKTKNEVNDLYDYLLRLTQEGSEKLAREGGYKPSLAKSALSMRAEEREELEKKADIAESEELARVGDEDPKQLEFEAFEASERKAAEQRNISWTGSNRKMSLVIKAMKIFNDQKIDWENLDPAQKEEFSQLISDMKLASGAANKDAVALPESENNPTKKLLFEALNELNKTLGDKARTEVSSSLSMARESEGVYDMPISEVVYDMPLSEGAVSSSLPDKNLDTPPIAQKRGVVTQKDNDDSKWALSPDLQQKVDDISNAAYNSSETNMDKVPTPSPQNPEAIEIQLLNLLENINEDLEKKGIAFFSIESISIVGKNGKRPTSENGAEFIKLDIKGDKSDAEDSLLINHKGEFYFADNGMNEFIADNVSDENDGRYKAIKNILEKRAKEPNLTKAISEQSSGSYVDKVTFHKGGDISI